ncbi:MAG TPA: flagellar hook-associated protein FlgK [Rhodopila sp.]|jgi:flagellar hook-associated protein 1 FlgK|nr:flagellar hook-associated protein FlgK [Rhodopila sp.]
MSGSLSSIISNAQSGLTATKAGIAVISNNVANAGVTSYSLESQDVSSFDVGGQTFGVQTGVVSRSVNAALEASAWAAASSVAGLSVQSQVLTAINNTQGTPGDGTSLADVVTALQSAFTNLQAQPSSQTGQSAVVAAANTLASTINNTADTITAQRNDVQSQIVSEVSTLNAALATVNSTTQQIISATGSGNSTAALEDQRDSALQTLSSTMNLQYTEQPNGNISLSTPGGLAIPLDSTFSTQSAVLSPGSTYTPGGSSVPPILLQSSNPDIPPVDVTEQISGGSLGSLIQLRDTTLPAYTTSLDTFSANLANQFSAQGLQLFTDGSGNTPLTSYAGLSSAIEVNPAVTATPSLVRDGTSGSANPGGAAGFTGVIDNVLNTTFGSTGTTPSLETQAQNFVSQQSADTEQVGTNLTNATAYQTTVGTALSNGSGVNVDQQMGLMIQLQNAYQANAQVITTAAQMFTALTEIFVQAVG